MSQKIRGGQAPPIVSAPTAGREVNATHGADESANSSVDVFGSSEQLLVQAELQAERQRAARAVLHQEPVATAGPAASTEMRQAGGVVSEQTVSVDSVVEPPNEPFTAINGTRVNVGELRTALAEPGTRTQANEAIRSLLSGGEEIHLQHRTPLRVSQHSVLQMLGGVDPAHLERGAYEGMAALSGTVPGFRSAQLLAEFAGDRPVAAETLLQSAVQSDRVGSALRGNREVMERVVGMVDGPHATEAIDVLVAGSDLSQAREWLTENIERLEPSQLSALSERVLGTSNDYQFPHGPSSVTVGDLRRRSGQRAVHDLRSSMANLFRHSDDPAVRESTAGIALAMSRDHAGIHAEAFPVVERLARAGDESALSAIGIALRTASGDSFSDVAGGASLLGELATGGETHELRRAAARELVDVIGSEDTMSQQALAHLGINDNPALLDRLIDEAVSAPAPILSRTPAAHQERTTLRRAREALSRSLPRPAMSSDRLAGFQDNYVSSLGAAIERAEEGTPMHDLGQLVRAAQIAASEEFQGRVDLDGLNAQLDATMTHPEVSAELVRLRDSALSASFPELAGRADPAEQIIEQLQEHARSPDFRRRLRLANPTVRGRIISEELAAIAGIDRQAAIESSQDILFGQLADDGFAMLARLPERERTGSLEQAIGGLLGSDPSFSDALEAHSMTESDLARIMSEELEEARQMGVPPTATNIMTRLGQRIPPGLMIPLQSARNLPVGRAMQGLGTVAASYNLYNNPIPGSVPDFFARSGEVLTVLDTGIDLANLGNSMIGSGLGSSSGWIRSVANSPFKQRYLGPAGVGLSSVAQAITAVDEFRNRDYVGGTAKAVGALAGGVTAGAMLMSASPGAGPAAPVVAATGAAVAAGAFAVDYMWGQTDEENHLHQLGLLR